MNTEKQERLSRIINANGKTVILPMDHGVSDGPIPGLVDMAPTLKKAREGGVSAIVIHKGIFKKYKEVIGNVPTLIHISASTGMGKVLKKVLIATPKEVKKLGATGVSIHLNIGNEFEPEMLADLGQVSRECEELGLPLLAMMYPRNEVNGQIVTYKEVEKVKHAARLAAELGADIVKVPYTGSADTFKEVVEGCHIPVVIAGGAKGSEEEIMNAIKECMSSGAAGISVGRNIFQRENMVEMIKKVKEIVL